MTIFVRFDPKFALEKLRGKRLLFVGDSLQRNQWESFVCMVEWTIPYNQKSMKVDGIHPVFTAKVWSTVYWTVYVLKNKRRAIFVMLWMEWIKLILFVDIVQKYNATIEFYWAPYLVNSNSDINIIGDPKKRIIKVDSITERAKNWTGVDILVFNTYVWWMSGVRIKSL